MSVPAPRPAVFGLDVSGFVEDVIRGLLDLVVPDFSGEWVSRLVSWLVALPDVTSAQQFAGLQAFRSGLTGAAFGLLALTFVAGALELWAAGFSNGSRTSALDAVRRTALAAGALLAYPPLLSALLGAVNRTTAAIVRHPQVQDGLETAIGGAFVLAVVSSGLSLGLAIGAVVACVAFLAALMVFKVALTAGLCVLLLCGPLVLALAPLPQADGLVRTWASGLVCCLTVPVAWAGVFGTAGLVSGDALLWGRGIGSGLEALVKPFVAVACFYLAYRAPAFVLAHARLVGLRVPPSASVIPGARGGGAAVGRSAQAVARTHADRFTALSAAAGARVAAGGRAAAGRVTGSVRSATSRAGQTGAPPGTARGAVTGAALSSASRVATAAAGAATAGQRANEWWRDLPERRAQTRHAAPAAGDQGEPRVGRPRPAAPPPPDPTQAPADGATARQSAGPGARTSGTGGAPAVVRFAAAGAGAPTRSSSTGPSRAASEGSGAQPAATRISPPTVPRPAPPAPLLPGGRPERPSSSAAMSEPQRPPDPKQLPPTASVAPPEHRRLPKPQTPPAPRAPTPPKPPLHPGGTEG